MRVCVVLNHMPAPGAGGLEGQVHDVCTGLLDRGVEVQVACRPSLYMPAGNVPLLEHVHTVTADLTPAEIDNRFLGMWRTSQDLAKAENWARYDVVHVQSHHGYHTALRLARMSGSRPALVTTFHLTAIGGIVRSRCRSRSTTTSRDATALRRRRSASYTTPLTRSCSHRYRAPRRARNSGSIPTFGMCCTWGRSSASAATCCWTA